MKEKFERFMSDEHILIGIAVTSHINKLIVSGSSYVDVSHMTLSKSTGVSAFSRVQNGSFELYNSSNVPTYWTPYLSNSLSVIDCSDAPDGYSLRINGGGVGWQTYAEQTIFETSAADKSTFISSPYTVTSKQYRVSGRAKASSALANPASTFGIRVIIKYIDESGAAQYDDVSNLSFITHCQAVRVCIHMTTREIFIFKP